jgi:hypothetical protein
MMLDDIICSFQKTAPEIFMVISFRTYNLFSASLLSGLPNGELPYLHKTLHIVHIQQAHADGLTIQARKPVLFQAARV